MNPFTHAQVLHREYRRSQEQAFADTLKALWISTPQTRIKAAQNAYINGQIEVDELETIIDKALHEDSLLPESGEANTHG